MLHRIASPCLLLLTILAGPAMATERPMLLDGDSAAVRFGRLATGARVDADTTYLLGGPDRLDGRFENYNGEPDWQGWTHSDATDDPESFWQISDVAPLAGLYSQWCGRVFPDGDRGYGNGWHQNLVFSHQIDDPALASTVVWRAALRVDVEPVYDAVLLQVRRGDQWQTLQSYDGLQTVTIDETFSLEPGEYAGPDGDLVQLRVRVLSDLGGSDEDGLVDTDGACQLDDVEVLVDGSVVDLEDFEDQTSERWLPAAEGGVGDFAALYMFLQDADPCISNYTIQPAFIDDGQVVPGTGGTMCITWCYGPGGYIVNNSGGLLGPEFHLDNLLQSPVMAWPAGADAAYLQFGAYGHEQLFDDSAGIFYQWKVRSVDTGDPADLATAPWRDQNHLYYGDPGYRTHRVQVTEQLVPGVTHVQVGLRAVELGYLIGVDGADGTPAPYFDNVQFVAYATAGPSISAVATELLNDGFPAADALDFDDLARNAVRCDMARNISPAQDLRNDPGDSVVFTAATIRAGAVLDGPPVVHVRMKANPLFRDVRMLPENFSLVEDGLYRADLVSGWVAADSVFLDGQVPVVNRWCCDLPDSGFFFPGDVIHYYVEARDNAAGDIGTAILPADTAGFARFTEPVHYDNLFTVRALPTLRSGVAGDQPGVLLWNDHGDPAAQDTWWETMTMLRREEGRNYDLFCTNGPSAGVGNGLGGRATAAVLDGYDTVLYTAGDQVAFLLGNGDFERDPSDDIGVLDAWLDLGGKHLLLTGDNVASALAGSGGQGVQFLQETIGVALVDRNLRPYIANQTAPMVWAVPGNGVLVSADRWIAYGGCLSINAFDAVTVQAETSRLAEFTDPAGNPGVYEYAAATLHHHPANDAVVALLPYDLTFLFTDPESLPPPGLSARAVVLDDFLYLFGDYPPPPPGVAPDAVLRVQPYPNPFNPSTTIALDLPRATAVALRIYDLRGRLVRTLVDERLAAGHHEIVWDGKDARGADAASGVFLCETRAAGEVRVHKLALVK